MAKKVPITRFPDSVALSYYREIKRLIDELGKTTLRVFDEQVKEQIKIYYNRQDASAYKLDGPLDIIQRAFEIIKGFFQRIFSPNKVEAIATRFLNSTNAFSEAIILKQGKVRGIDPTVHEPWLAEYMRSCITENVSYITNIKDEYFQKIESIILQGVKNGKSIKSIREQLVEKIGMSQKRAQFIAVDQTGSIFGQMNAKRHQQMGVEKFKWSTSHDERVRMSHRALDGHIYSYNKPPSEGLPGTPFRCRCVAIPEFD